MSFVIIFLYIAYKIHASCTGFEQDNYDRKMVSPSIFRKLALCLSHVAKAGILNLAATFA